MKAELSPRTLRMLLSWEKKHGLDVIQQHLDNGLFSRDREQQRLAYVWLEQRRVARRNNMIAEIAILATLLIAVIVGLIRYIWAE